MSAAASISATASSFDTAAAACAAARDAGLLREHAFVGGRWRPADDGASSR